MAPRHTDGDAASASPDPTSAPTPTSPAAAAWGVGVPASPEAQAPVDPAAPAAIDTPSAVPARPEAPAAPERPARLTVALVRGLRGLRGQVRVELLTDRPEDRFTVGAKLHVEGSPRVLTIVEASAVADGPGWWLRFKEVHDREEADALRDAYLEIDPPVEGREPGRWFFHEIEGLLVQSAAGDELGRITEIYRAGGAEVFVVRGPRGEFDVPGVRGIVIDLDPAKGRMIVDLEALDLDARPVDDEDYVRPRDRRPQKQPKLKGPAQPPKGTGPVRKPVVKGPSSTPAGTQPKQKGKTKGAPRPDPKPAASSSAGESTPASAPEPPADPSA